MKCALVTGGSRGIGRAVCIKMAEAGYHVLINYKGNEAAALETLEAVKAKGSTGELMPFNVGDAAEVQQVLGSWVENNKEQQIEVLVNNAGIREDSLMFWMNEAQWSNVLNISLNGFFNVTKQVLNGMLLKRYGRIINMVSLSGIKGLPGQTNYSAAKAGVIGATKALAQEVAKRGVTVNAVAPGFIRTDMTAELNEKELAAQVPMNRFGTAEEVADAVAFLASKSAGYITGEILNINGGLHT
ncbi:3-oxoacyl-ACP reductase FabG [Chitinophaga sp. CC14]|uniref:3-oxoacyl-ACP reductase FabG n=1 Tax=Chitinophaga TaxID=79328 RepID=UPI000DBA7F32|nr:3-oxoacyl-ACP reductase FabG [Chitinophaga ginsengisegetis]MDR6566998.1 3-oxoacyl-[acyl-carrier protein] reductase [Chitinophaga ginsengisegetis]MDR6646728.1 3-oxoacyl-[acyl-carrier protein] reductase [Chitinophaga ginsengisegetis]MDR6653078.1 3-oxoacyl-[acyl-carrier protein] reductase [Chitinophaga ginsengisegetis]